MHVQGCALHAHVVHVCSKEEVLATNVDLRFSTEAPKQCRKELYILWSDVKCYKRGKDFSNVAIHLNYNLSVSDESDEMFVA